MDVQIDISKDFDKDLKKLSRTDNSIITRKIRYIIDLLKSNQSIGHDMYKLHGIPVSQNFSSSLYVIKVNRTLRVILTYEDDPIFNQKIITLIRIVNHNQLGNTYKGLHESFYQSFLNQRRING
jgi:addiction module RelE/StbE family toxin